MKESVERLKTDLSEKLDLPYNILSNEPLIEIWAGKRARIENHKGIALYSDNTVIIRTQSGSVNIKGDKLKISSLIKEEIVIEGNITSAELK